MSEEEFRAGLGEVVVLLRGPLTQREFARRAGVDPSHIQNLELGINNVGINTLYRVAACCQMTPAAVLRMAEDRALRGRSAGR